MALAFVPIYVRYLGIEAYGLIGALLSLYALFSLLDLGLSSTMSREIARLSVRASESAQAMNNLLTTFECLYWAVAAVLGAAVAVLAPFLANHWVNAVHLNPSTIVVATRLMGVSLALQWPFTLYSGTLLGLQRQVLLSAITAGMATLRAVGAVAILVFISPTLPAFFLWQVLCALVQTILGAVLARKALPNPANRGAFQAAVFKPVWRYAAALGISSAIWAVITQVDKVVLSHALSLEAFGYYTLASLVAGSIYYLTNPIFLSLFPRFSELVAAESKDRLEALYHQGAELLSILVLPAGLLIAFYPLTLVNAWTANVDTAEKTHLVLSLLVLGTTVSALVIVPYAVQLAYGWARLSLFINVASLIAIGPLMYSAAVRYGAIGAAAVWLALNTASLVASVWIMHRRILLGQLSRWLVKDVGTPLFSTAVVLLAALTIESDRHLMELNRFAAIGYLVITLAAAVALSILLAPQARRQALRMLSFRPT